MHHMLQLLAAAGDANAAAADVVSLVITSVVSATVFSALITGLVQFLINRRNSRITERKNTSDAESDLVRQYRDAAADERAAKESAIKTLRELHDDTKEQVLALRSTVDTLNATIVTLKDLNASQDDIIVRLTEDRDRTIAALNRAETRIQQQEVILSSKQQEINDLIVLTQVKATKPSLDSGESVVE